MSIDEIKAAIARISEELRGPMSNVERTWLVDERSDLRQKLAELEGLPDPGRSPTPYDNSALRKRR